MGGLSFRAVQGLSVDDEDLVRQPALAEIQGDNAKCGFSEASLRQEAELRTLLASLRHADRELRTARSAIAASAPAQPDRLRRSRSLDREEMQNQLVSCKLRAAQLEEERDEHLHAWRQLTGARQLGENQAASLPRPARSARLPSKLLAGGMHRHQQQASTQ